MADLTTPSSWSTARWTSASSSWGGGCGGGGEGPGEAAPSSADSPAAAIHPRVLTPPLKDPRRRMSRGAVSAEVGDRVVRGQGGGDALGDRMGAVAVRRLAALGGGHGDRQPLGGEVVHGGGVA